MPIRITIVLGSIKVHMQLLSGLKKKKKRTAINLLVSQIGGGGGYGMAEETRRPFETKFI